MGEVPIFDLKVFWEDNRASQGKPFSTKKKRAPVELSLDDHWLLEEMRVPSTVQYYEDVSYRAKLHISCNDRCEHHLGIRPFDEACVDPVPLRIEQVFGCQRVVIEGGTPWLETTLRDIQDLIAILDDLAQMDEDAVVAKALSNGAELRPSSGERVMWSRGPATAATSIIGTERFIEWLIDEPELMTRFFDVFASTLIKYHEGLAHRTGATISGAAFLDDNCCLLSPPYYQKFCLAVLQKVFKRFAPRKSQTRFQHSDSAMGHLLPILAPLNFTGVNLGPTIPVGLIRQMMPKAVIHGQIAPMTLRNGSLEQITEEVRRDFDAVGSDGGIVMATAGSIPAGTKFDNILHFMWAVQTYCRYL